jgi:hypothetical protein
LDVLVLTTARTIGAGARIPRAAKLSRQHPPRYARHQHEEDGRERDATCSESATRPLEDAGEDSQEPAGVALIEAPNDDAGRRKLVIATIAGRLEDNAVNWPPKWPLTLAPEPGDPAALCELVKQLDLDREGYSHPITDAYELTASRPYEQLHVAISHGLETHRSADANTLHRLKMIAEDKSMEHTTKAASATITTEAGEFTAIAATYTVDRQSDTIAPGAFAKTIARRQAARTSITLEPPKRRAQHLRQHRPHTMREITDGLEQAGPQRQRHCP